MHILRFPTELPPSTILVIICSLYFLLNANRLNPLTKPILKLSSSREVHTYSRIPVNWHIIV